MRRNSKKSIHTAALLIAFVVAPLLIIFYQAVIKSQYGIPYLAGMASLTVFFALAALNHARHHFDFYAFAGSSVVVSLSLIAAFGPIYQYLLSSFGIGILAGALPGRSLLGGASTHRPRPMQVRESRLEIRRDLFQILLGLIVLSIILAAPSVSGPVVLALLIVALFYSDFASTGNHDPVTGFLRSIERSGTTFGTGALYLAGGTAIIIGFISQQGFMLTALLALFVGDAAATIVGLTYGRTMLPYNKSKSVEGLLAYVSVVAACGYIFIGAYALLLGIVLALIEGLRIRVDDNLTTSAAAVLIYAALFLAHLA